MLEFEGISVWYGTQKVVADLNLRLHTGELLTLLGSSGCGKSTLISVAAGFVTPQEGQVLIDGQDVTQLPPEKRPTATIFQSFALFPHMDVRENISYGLKARGIPSRERAAQADAMLEKVGLAGFGDRRVQTLSGGQQQRVALARTLVLHPSVLLLDEPLSSLDASLRVQMRNEIRKLQQEFKLTALYVTHDQEEAFAISDRVAVMNGGHIEQLGTPEELVASPATPFVESFISSRHKH